MSKTTLYFYLAGSLLFILIRYVLGLDGLYGQDSYEYLRYTNALHAFITNGNPPGEYFWPVYYPFVGSILKIIIPSTSLVLQLISAFSLLTALLYIKKTINLVLPSGSKIINGYLILFFLLSPMLFRMGFLCMSDMLSLLFTVLALYHYLQYFSTKNVSSLYFAMLFTLLAVLTRYASFVLLLPFGIYLAFSLLKTRKHYVHLMGLLLVSAVVILPHYYLKSQNPIAFLKHDWLQDWALVNFCKRSFVTVDGWSTNVLPNVFYAFSNAFHPRFFCLGIPFIIMAFAQKPKVKFFWVLLSSYLLYSFFLAGIPFQNNRFLVLSFPILLVLLFPAFLYACEISILKKYRKLFFLALLVLNFSLCLYGLKPILERNTFEKKMVSAITAYQNNILYSFDVDVALQGRQLKFEYRNLWVKEYPSFEENALVLFHPTKFAKQWDNKNPMINWNHLNTNYQLEWLKKCPDGWNLYKIHHKN
jgi:4-amino-4-deoxy-L-arabinose transferase-like glycosyltransferase